MRSQRNTSTTFCDKPSVFVVWAGVSLCFGRNFDSLYHSCVVASGKYKTSASLARNYFVVCNVPFVVVFFFASFVQRPVSLLCCRLHGFNYNQLSCIVALGAKVFGRGSLVHPMRVADVQHRDVIIKFRCYFCICAWFRKCLGRQLLCRGSVGSIEIQFI